MDCPFCGKTMTPGGIVYQNRWLAGAWANPPLKHFAQAFYRDGTVVFSAADEGWHCPDCKKTVAVFDTAEGQMFCSAVNDGIAVPRDGQR